MSEIISREMFKSFLLVVLFLFFISASLIIFLIPIPRTETNSDWITMRFISPRLPTGRRIASEVSNKSGPSKNLFRPQKLDLLHSKMDPDEATGCSPQNEERDEFGLDILSDKWRLAVKLGGHGFPLNCTQRKTPEEPLASDQSNCSTTLPQINVIIPYRCEFTCFFAGNIFLE